VNLACITNTLNDFRPCSVRDSHLPTCNGREERWSPERGQYFDTGRECSGCEPREARAGLVCRPCYARVESARAEWTDVLSSIDRAVQRPGGGGKPEGYVPLPGTKLAVDEVRSYERSGLGMSIGLWLATEAGAADAVRFARSVQIALRTHQLEERPSKVTRVRCPECDRITLVWKPPHDREGHVVITCSNEVCGKTITQSELAFLEVVGG
jgi:ribosomal protein S27E